jgi:uncharacterized protein YacL
MLIEAVRLVVTLAATALGFSIGRGAPGWTEAATNPDTAAVIGALIGAGVGYVVGGLTGRLVRRGIDRVPDAVDRVSGAQLFAGAFGLVAGLLVGAVAAVPAIVLLPEVAGWSVGALLVIVLAAVGARAFISRSEDLLAAAGLANRRRPGSEPDAARQFVVDSSAAIDGRILDLARAGLLRGEVTIPGFVVDELQGIADSGQINRRRRPTRPRRLEAMAEAPGFESQSMSALFRSRRSRCKPLALGRTSPQPSSPRTTTWRKPPGCGASRGWIPRRSGRLCGAVPSPGMWFRW